MIKIDVDTRCWQIPKQECLLGVESDNKVKILQFELSKNEFCNGLNFTNCNCFINYKNEGNDTIPYLITDMEVQEDGTVTFTWEVSRGATIFKGNTFAILCAKKVRDDGTITNEWNSRIGSFTVSKGLEPSSSIVEVPEIDIISQLLLVAQHNIDQSSSLLEKAEGLGYLKEDFDVLEARMNQFTSLKEGSTTGDAELIDGRIGYDGTVYDNIGGAIRGQVSELNGDLGELDTRLSESINDITKNFEIVGISPNVVDMTKIKRGEYIHTNGQNASNEKYLHTDFIPVETGDKIESWRYTGSRWTQNSYNMRYVCAYGAEKNVMPASGAESQTLYTVPDNVKFIIISTDASWIDTKTQMILKNYDEIPTEFIDFSKGNYVAKSEFISEDVKENIAKRAVKTFDDLRINKGYFSIDGGSMEQPIEFPYHNVNARYRITFNAKVADMGTVSFVFKNGETEYARIDIDSADIKYYLDGVLKYTYSHGITIANTLQLILETNNNPSNIYRRYGLILTLKSNGQSFSTPAKGSDEIVVERLSKCDVKSISTTGTLSDAKAVWSFLNSQKYIYAFGDSYFSWSEKRWVYYLAEDGYADNLLTDAFTGRRSVEALESFKNVMKLGHPKYVFWCIGMNDRDTTVVNQNWLNAFEYVKSYCKENGIVLILATIPCVSNESYKNEPKNAVVRASGLRYIDFAKAVNAETEGSGWYEGMLDTDNVHPTALGAKTLYAQVLSDFPEICF